MSVKGSFNVTVFMDQASGSVRMDIRADMVTANPNGHLYVYGDRQQRHFAPGLRKSITIENDRMAVNLPEQRSD